MKIGHLKLTKNQAIQNHIIYCTNSICHQYLIHGEDMRSMIYEILKM